MWSHDRQYTVLRRRNPFAWRAAAAPPNGAYSMHPHSPLLSKLDFGNTYDEAHLLVYVLHLQIACWGMSQEDANSLAHELLDLLDARIAQQDVLAVAAEKRSQAVQR